VTGWLVYDDKKPLPDAAKIDKFDPFDDFTLVPEDGEELFDKVDHSITFNLKMDNLGDGANYAFLNDVTYVEPVVPTLYSTLSTGGNATDPTIYGVNTNPHIVRKGEIVELILNNHDPGKHPFHLHGHVFQVAYRSDQASGSYKGVSTKQMASSPMRRDTVLVNPNGNIVLRFRADNPGIWLFHCHIEWYVSFWSSTR
jgi:iron transport multicopper oxidase